MIQRIQSVYLLLSAICSIVCLSLPVGRYVSDGLLSATMYNLWIASAADGSRMLTSAPLFVILLLAAAVSLYTIFIYKNRKQQIRLSSFSSLLIVGWYVVYAAIAMLCGGADAGGAVFSPSVYGALPAAALILNLMASRAIRADERLVRAADRIR